MLEQPVLWRFNTSWAALSGAWSLELGHVLRSQHYVPVLGFPGHIWHYMASQSAALTC